MPSRITHQHAAMPDDEQPPIINQRPTDNPPIALIRPTKFTYDNAPASVAPKAKAKRPPARRLTQQEINGLRGRETEYKVRDGAVPGFYIVVSPRGTLSWMVMLSIRKPGGGSQQRSVTFARTDEMTLAQARREAERLKIAARQGIDPKAPKAPVKPRLTVRGLIDRYLEQRIDLGRSAGTLRQYRALATSIISKWGDRDANSLTKDEINEFIWAISRKRQRAYSPAPDSRPLAHSDNTLSFLKAMYKEGYGRSWVKHNPALQVPRLLQKPGKRHRVLTREELISVWAGCETLGYPRGPMFQLSLLSSARMGEVAKMEWREIDFAAATWVLPDSTIPAATEGRLKNDITHVVYLSPQALAILRKLRDGPDYVDERWVFTINSRKPVGDWQGASVRLRELMEKDIGPTPRWLPHDLRRSSAAWMRRLHPRVDRWVIELCLNHSVMTSEHRHLQLSDVADTYIIEEQEDYAAEKKDAWKRLGAFIDDLVHGRDAARHLTSGQAA